MEQRIKNLEDLCELITKEVVEQNKNMIEMNKNLIQEIRALREAYVKQDDDFEEFKILLRKIYDLNRQVKSYPYLDNTSINSLINFLNIISKNSTTLLPPIYQPNIAQQQLANQQPNLALTNLAGMNNSLLDQINQSMMNNLSFQSVQTPLHQNQAPSYINLNTSNIPISASVMNQQQQPQQSQQPQLQQQQPPPVVKQVQVPVFNPNQPPPSLFQPTQVSKQVPQQQPVQIQQQNIQQQPQQPLFKFAPSVNTTSTPQNNQFVFKQLPQQQQQQQQQPQQPQQPTQQQIQQKPPQFELSPAKPQAQAQPLVVKPTISQPVQQVQPTQAQSVFAGANLFKPQQSPQKQQQQQQSPFQFTGFQPGQNLFKTTPVDLVKKQEEEHEEGESNEKPEEYEPQVDFKPIVQLKEVQVKTGEEDEDVLFKQRCKLYRFDSDNKEWKEKGVGEIKLLKHKNTNVIRVLMRRDQVLKLCANHRISSDMKLNEISPKQLSWMAIDFSENESKSELLLAKFRTPEEASQFRTEFDKAVQEMKIVEKSTPKKQQPQQPVTISSDKPSLSQVLKTDTWKCNACYAPNKKDDLKCACCSALKPGVSQEEVKTLTNANTSQTSFGFGQTANKPFSFGLNTTTQQQQQQQQTQQTQQTNNQPKFDFSAKENILKNASTTFTPFGSTPTSQTSQTNQPQSTQQTLFGASTMPSFALLAAKTTGTLFGNTDSSTSASPIFKPLGFNGGLQPNTQTPKPLFGTGQTTTPITTTKTETPQEGNEETGENENPEEYEPQVDFKPLVKLTEVEVKTGEENEDAVFKQRCKLYRYDSNTKEWKEKGTGEIKVLKHKTSENMYRILMRRDQVLKLCANHRVTSDLKLDIFNEKQVRWYAQDYSEGEGKHELLAVRFKNEEDAKKFKQSVEDAQKAIISNETGEKKSVEQVSKSAETKNICEGLKPTLATMFKQDTDTWTCDGCYVKNKNDIYKCVACQSARKGADGKPIQIVEKNKSLNQTQSTTTTTTKFSFGMQPNTNQTTQFSFGQTTFGQPVKPSTNEPSKTSLFSTLTPSVFGNAPQAQSLENVFGTKQGLSFADLAKNTPQTGFSGGFINQQSTNPLFSSQAKPLFSSAQINNKVTNEEDGEEAGENQNPEEYEPQVDFKPLVKLTEVEVKTGEEDEDVLFKQRCKLYRFDSNTKEWKEKGVGEIKILKHKQKENSYRILMRRDQVLKLCANHHITSDMKLESVNEKQLRWMANDCSEGETHLEVLTVRFRNEEDAKKFKEEFEKCQQLVKNKPVVNTINKIKSENNINIKQENSLANSLKSEQGTWECSGCLTKNKPNSVKCACCNFDKPNNGLNENDIQVVYQSKASDEQIEKARSLGLPDNFYLYLTKPDCKGCVGCKNEE